MISYKLHQQLFLNGSGLLKVLKLMTKNDSGARNLSLSRSISAPPITTASIDDANNSLKVVFNNEVEHEYPWLFLQDNCTCANCFHTSSLSRKRLMTQLDLTNKLTSVQINNSDKIICNWSDGHESEFSEEWLLKRCFSDEHINKRRKFPNVDVEFLSSFQTMQRSDYRDVLQDQSILLHLLLTLHIHGAFLIKNAPKRTGELKKLIEKIGFIRTTHYGNEFTVKTERNASNLAYTSTTLCVHTDLPYYVYPPGVQLLHCIQQYDGNEGAYSHLVDGFLVGDHMKRVYQEEYKILSEVEVEFADKGADFTRFHKVHHSPTFVLSRSRQLIRIVYSNQQLSSIQPIPLKHVKPLYEALKLFTTLCYDEANLMRFKLKEGDILVFDNWRMLHGREGFDSTKGDRHLEGCYIDWDEVDSTIRVLQDSSDQKMNI